MKFSYAMIKKKEHLNIKKEEDKPWNECEEVGRPAWTVLTEGQDDGF